MSDKIKHEIMNGTERVEEVPELPIAKKSRLEVDVLKLTEPIMKYQYLNYDHDSKSPPGPPHYKFALRNLNELREGEAELKGEVFQVPNFDLKAQIKCVVQYNECHFYLAFVDEEKVGQPLSTIIIPKIFTYFKNKNNDKFQCSSDEQQRVRLFDFAVDPRYGHFYYFNKFSLHGADIKKLVDSSSTNSITLGLKVTDGSGTKKLLRDGLLIWKVKVDRAQLTEMIGENDDEHDLGMTPFLYTEDKAEIRVQIRLFRDQKDDCRVQVRFVNRSGRAMSSYQVVIKVFHPANSYPPLIEAFDLSSDGQDETLRKAKYRVSDHLATKDQLLRYVNPKDDLMTVRIKLR